MLAAQHSFDFDCRIHVAVDALRVLQSARQAVRKTLNQRLALDRAGLKDVPLVVVSGENHYYVSHNIHHMLFIDGVSRREKTAVSYEGPHARPCLDFAARRLARRELTAAEFLHLKAKDKEGVLPVKADMGFHRYETAPHARAALFRLLLERKIPTRLTDVALRPDQTLDPKDRSTAAALRKCLRGRPYRGTRIEGSSVFGMRTRNFHMARMGWDFARATGARILFQQCGGLHVAGYRYRGRQGEIFCPPSFGLCAQFKSFGAPVIALPLFDSSEFTERNVPHNHGLAPEEFPRLPTLPAVPLLEPVAYVNTLLATGGLEAACLTGEEWRGLRHQCRADVRAAMMSAP
jgi:hypothetical protein